MSRRVAQHLGARRKGAPARTRDGLARKDGPLAPQGRSGVLPLIVLAGAGALAAAGCHTAAQETELFREDFESGLGHWVLPLGQGARLVDSGDPAHGRVLELQTRDRLTVALIDGSEDWDDVRLEGAVLFPEDVHNYLGFVYRYREQGGRTDFGSLYIKGNNSYIRVNPHHDLNVGRTLFEEYRTPLTGAAEVRIGEWKPFALEVVGREAHLYVGDMTRPQITFPYSPTDRGAFGFKPRNPGGAAWVDDLSVRPISAFTYRGPPLPEIDHVSPPMDPAWHVLGPLTSFAPQVEASQFDATAVASAVVTDGGRRESWRPYQPDPRGAVLSGTVTDTQGPRRVAYFSATVETEGARDATLSISTADDLAIWVNGRFLGFVDRSSVAWWDAWLNPDHRGVAEAIRLEPGPNHLLVRVVGGVYASGGFFLRVIPQP